MRTGPIRLLQRPFPHRRRVDNAAIFGDPVEVTNSSVPLTLGDGDIADWTVAWSQWPAVSALAGLAAR